MAWCGWCLPRGITLSPYVHVHDVSVLHSSLGLNHRPSCVYATPGSSIHALGDTWDVSLFCGERTVLHLALVCTHLSVCFRLRRPGTLGSHCPSVFHFLRNHQTFFHVSCPDTPTSQAQGSAFSIHIFSGFWLLAVLVSGKWHLIVVLTRIVLMGGSFHVSIRHLCVILREMFDPGFAPFLTAMSFCHSDRSSLCILQDKVLSYMRFTRTFSHLWVSIQSR